MVNELKLDQVYNAISENGLKAFDDEALARLLAILNPTELDLFEMEAFSKLGGFAAYDRIRRVRPLIDMIIRSDVHSFKSSSLFKEYIKSLQSRSYREFFKGLTVNDLASIKKYVTSTMKKDKVNISASKKIIKILTQEIAAKEAQKNLTFS